MSYTEQQKEGLHIYIYIYSTVLAYFWFVEVKPYALNYILMYLLPPSISPWLLVFPFAATPVHSWCGLSLSPAPLSGSGSGVHPPQPVFSHTFRTDLRLKGKRPDVRLQRTVGRWKSDNAFNTLIKAHSKGIRWRELYIKLKCLIKIGLHLLPGPCWRSLWSDSVGTLPACSENWWEQKALSMPVKIPNVFRHFALCCTL